MFYYINLTLKVKVKQSTQNGDFNQGVLHFWFKFGDSSLNGWQIKLLCGQAGRVEGFWTVPGFYRGIYR